MSTSTYKIYKPLVVYRFSVRCANRVVTTSPYPRGEGILVAGLAHLCVCGGGGGQNIETMLFSEFQENEYYFG